MTRQSLQQGYVSDPIRTRKGIAYKIRYRIRAGLGKWKQKSETLYGLKGKKAARQELADRIKDSSPIVVGLTDLTLEEFIERFWQPYLNRKNVKPSTRRSYRSMLDLHILPILRELRLKDVSPLHVDELLQAPGVSSCSPKTVRNLVGLLGSIFALAVDKDLVVKSPVRKKPQANSGKAGEAGVESRSITADHWWSSGSLQSVFCLCSTDWRSSWGVARFEMVVC